MTELKTINIKGKDYVAVNERLSYFRTAEEYKNWSLETEVISLTNESVVLKAVIKDELGRVRATGLASEDKAASQINKTSYMENCETSAWGRALGNLGIGIPNSICSAEEVSNAIYQQDRNSAVTAQKVPNQGISMDAYIGRTVNNKGVEYTFKKKKDGSSYFLVSADGKFINDFNMTQLKAYFDKQQ